VSRPNHRGYGIRKCRESDLNAKKIVYAFLACAAAATSSASDWYDNVQLVMGRVEQASDQTIWLMAPTSRNGAAVAIAGHSSSCGINPIHLTPPAGESSAWLAMVLSAPCGG
jgi:hypothetical protein